MNQKYASFVICKHFSQRITILKANFFFCFRFVFEQYIRLQRDLQPTSTNHHKKQTVFVTLWPPSILDPSFRRHLAHFNVMCLRVCGDLWNVESATNSYQASKQSAYVHWFFLFFFLFFWSFVCTQQRAVMKHFWHFVLRTSAKG